MGLQALAGGVDVVDSEGQVPEVAGRAVVLVALLPAGDVSMDIPRKPVVAGFPGSACMSIVKRHFGWLWTVSMSIPPTAFQPFVLMPPNKWMPRQPPDNLEVIICISAKRVRLAHALQRVWPFSPLKLTSSDGRLTDSGQKRTVETSNLPAISIGSIWSSRPGGGYERPAIYT